MKKKLLAAALALAMLAPMAGCGDSGATSTPTPPAQTQAAEQTETPDIVADDDTPAEYNGVDVLQISEDPMELTLFYAFGANGAPTGDMPIWQAIQEYTNVAMRNVANPSIADDAESFNAMLLDNTKPDLILAQTGTIQPVAQDLLIPLDDLIAEYAPNIQAYLNSLPEAKVASTHADGNTYYIAGSLSGKLGSLLPSMGFFIRQDWLDTLGLPVPTTFEEFRDTLYAFRNDDPNGNGERDEAPYFYRDRGVVGLYQLWGVGGSWAQWCLDANGKVTYGRIQPEYQNALRDLAQWYADGVIDSEIFTRGSQARQELLGNNTGGVTMDWFASTANMNYNEDILAQVPDMNFVSILPPADVNGVSKQIYSRAPISDFVWGISFDCADPVAAIRFMDFMFTEESGMLSEWGVEGISYQMVNGVPEFLPAAHEHPAGIPNYMRSIGAAEVPGRPTSIEVEVDQMSDIARDGFLLYFDSDALVAPFPPLTFTEEEQSRIDEVNVNVSTAFDTYEQQVLLGDRDVDATWDAYIAEIRGYGFFDVIDIYQAAYDRYLAIAGQ